MDDRVSVSRRSRNRIDTRHGLPSGFPVSFLRFRRLVLNCLIRNRLSLPRFHF
jgi:hypothetical protein